MRAWALGLVLGGCSFAAPGNSNSNGDGNDAAPDAPVSTPPDAAIDANDGGGTAEQICLGTFIKVCVARPSTALALTNLTINTADTTSASLCVPYTADPMVDACVIAAPSITIPAGNMVTVVGTKRLVLLATDTLTVAGTLDAASRRDSPGPAANTGPCQTNFRNPTTDSEGGGGWGGSFGGNGNNGGTGAGGGIGGVAATAGNITTLTGGCPGGNGAPNDGGNGAGGGGPAGGAVLLIARQTLVISGTVNASGAGGGGGRGGGGGGGGGTGGMIVLDAATVNIPGRCFANGGGGGEGGSLTGGNDGQESTAPSSAGGGGDGGSLVGGAGGNGGFGVTGPRGGGSGGVIAGSGGGGGGGGGGVGVIRVFSANPPSTNDLARISPPPR